jgi:2-keto-4-pentenoate hydratase
MAKSRERKMIKGSDLLVAALEHEGMARFVDRRSAGWPSFAADDSGFEALVVGEPIDERQIPELLSSLIVSVDGQKKARAAAGDDATDPYGALADLISIARERRMILPNITVAVLL